MQRMKEQQLPTLSSNLNPERGEVPCLYPVILRMPRKAVVPGGALAVKALSRFARQALRISGERTGGYPRVLLKGSAGEPLACRGIHWSIAHKPDFVTGVVSSFSVGIDIERLRPVAESLFRRILTSEESDCFEGNDRTEIFFRTFTAKEAVLKAMGLGLAGLARVRVVGAPQATTTLIYNGVNCYVVDHFRVDDHLASVVRGGSGVVWEVVGSR